MTTTFIKNANLNFAFGNQQGNILKPDFSKIQNQSKLVLEETRELLEAAFYTDDVTLSLSITPKPSDNPVYGDPEAMIKALRDIMDAQGDITTVNDGVAYITGFNGDECLQRVYASNMSKFIASEEELAPALQYYYDLGFKEGDLYIHGDYPRACIKVAETITVGGKEYPKGKFLKNMAKFQEPDFEDMLTNQPKQQIKTIIVSTMCTPGQVYVDDAVGMAVMHASAFDLFMSECEKVTMFELTDNASKMVESYIPGFQTKDGGVVKDIPRLAGMWQANVRVFTSVPFENPITQLTRID